MAEWVTNTISAMGYWGIALLMFLENLFPPIPSELIMPLAGFTAARGEMALLPVILSGGIGALVGAILWYFAGLWVGMARLRYLANRYGKWFGISAKDMRRSQKWFDRYGGLTVFIGRLIPGIRTLISVPAGTCEMSFVPFLFYSTLGTLVWTTFLTLAGYLLGENYELVETVIGPISKIVLIALLLAGVFWVLKRNLRSRHHRRQP